MTRLITAFTFVCLSTISIAHEGAEGVIKERMDRFKQNKEAMKAIKAMKSRKVGALALPMAKRLRKMLKSRVTRRSTTHKQGARKGKKCSGRSWSCSVGAGGPFIREGDMCLVQCVGNFKLQKIDFAKRRRTRVAAATR